MKRGDVFTVSMRGATGKPRPGIVVQADELIRTDRSVLVCPLTSDLLPDLLSRPRIHPSSENGLRTVSQAMVDRITPALPREIGHVIGHLSQEDMRLVELSLLIVFGLMRHLAEPEQ